nr:MAG TPA: hypothetical protein [Caudoviricetes sp.]
MEHLLSQKYLLGRLYISKGTYHKEAQYEQK